MYLTAFPVQQTIIATHPGIAPATLVVATVAVTVPLAWLLWTCVERPALHGVRGLPFARRGSA